MKKNLRWMLCCSMVMALGSCDRPMSLHGEKKETITDKQAYNLNSVPVPDEDKIRVIRTAEDWHNPYIIIGPIDFELIHDDQSKKRNRYNLLDLENFLLNLPLAKWPLGKVIAVQEIGIRSSHDDEKIKTNREALIRMLQSHRIKVDLWPSA